jgi:hypothetical protein
MGTNIGEVDVYRREQEKERSSQAFLIAAHIFRLFCIFHLDKKAISGMATVRNITTRALSSL